MDIASNMAFLEIANIDYSELYIAVADTLLMLGISIIFSSIIGIALGFVLYFTNKNHLFANKYIYFFLSMIINILRSVPFIILLILMMPITTVFLGTSMGIKGVVPTLIVGAFPFVARLIENSLNNIEDGIIQMSLSYGASLWQIIWHILLPEVLPNIITSITVTLITLVSYTAMAGVVGGGGLGDLAIRYGYQRFQTDVMIVTVVLLIFLVQIIQLVGDKIANKFKKK